MHSISYFIPIYLSIHSIHAQFDGFTFPTPDPASGSGGSGSGGGFPVFPGLPTKASTPTTPTPAPTLDPSKPSSTGYWAIGPLGHPLNVCVNGKDAGQSKSAQWFCKSDKSAVSYSEWDNLDCSGSPKSTVANMITSMLGGFDCETKVNYWVGRTWGNQTGTCAQNEDYWYENPVVTNMCFSIFSGSAASMIPAGMNPSWIISDCDDCGCTLKDYTDAGCAQSTFSFSGQFDVACTDGICNTADPNVCTKEQICPRTPSSPGSGGTGSTPKPTPKPTPKALCLDNMNDCGFLVLGLEAYPVNVCLKGMYKGDKISAMWSCVDDKLYYKEWLNTQTCSDNPKTTVAWPTITSFTCKDEVPSYFLTKVYSNDTQCSQDEDNWIEQAVIVEHCFALTTIGPSFKIYDCEACQCTTSIYTDSECNDVQFTSNDKAPFCDDTHHYITVPTPECADETESGSGDNNGGGSGGKTDSGSTKSGSVGVIVSVASVVVVLALIGAGLAYYFFVHRKKQQETYNRMELDEPINATDA